MRCFYYYNGAFSVWLNDRVILIKPFSIAITLLFMKEQTHFKRGVMAILFVRFS